MKVEGYSEFIALIAKFTVTSLQVRIIVYRPSNPQHMTTLTSCTRLHCSLVLDASLSKKGILCYVKNIVRDFISIFSRRATGFHRQATNFLN